jgi:hypothetical protein
MAEDAGPNGGSHVQMPGIGQIVFTTPDVTVSCGGSACYGLGQSNWMLPLDGISLVQSHMLPGGALITQYIIPSLIYSNMTEFTGPYSSV